MPINAQIHVLSILKVRSLVSDYERNILPKKLSFALKACSKIDTYK